MKKIKSKSVIRILMASIFMLNMFSSTAFAAGQMSEEAQEALSFIRGVGIITGEVISASEHDGEIDFSVKYLPNNQITHLLYSENEQGITVIIDEGNAINEVVFENNGNVTVDGEPFPYYTNFPMTIDSGYYVYQHFDTCPNGWTEPGGSPSRLNDVIGASSWTVSTMATVIGLKVPMWQAKAIAVASIVLSGLAGPVADWFGFSINYTEWKNLDRSPLQILTKSRLIITVNDEVKHDDYRYHLATMT